MFERYDAPQVSFRTPRSSGSQACAVTAPVTRVTQEELFRHHRPSLRRLARRLASNDSDAEDLVQDTFERSLRKLPPGLPPERVRAWLIATLRNRFVDLKRAADTRLRLSQELPPQVVVPPSESGEEPRWIQVQPEQLWSCADQLVPPLREVFLLRARGGQSQAMVAQSLGIAVSTVGTRYHRALRFLRQMLMACSGGGTLVARAVRPTRGTRGPLAVAGRS